MYLKIWFGGDFPWKAPAPSRHGQGAWPAPPGVLCGRGAQGLHSLSPQPQSGATTVGKSTGITEGKSLSRVQLFATPWATVHGVPQVRTLEWVAIPFSRASSQPSD